VGYFAKVQSRKPALSNVEVLQYIHTGVRSERGDLGEVSWTGSCQSCAPGLCQRPEQGILRHRKSICQNAIPIKCPPVILRLPTSTSQLDMGKPLTVPVLGNIIPV
jgi:hypothetical protein